jgi:hypothetical protein
VHEGAALKDCQRVERLADRMGPLSFARWALLRVGQKEHHLALSMVDWTVVTLAAPMADVKGTLKAEW